MDISATSTSAFIHAKHQLLWAQFSMRIGECLAAAAFGVIVLERCNFNGMEAFWHWLPSSRGLTLAALLALSAAYGALRVFFARPAIPFAVYGGLTWLVGASNYYKLYYRNEPLVPYDLFNIAPAMSIAGRMNLHFDRGLKLNLAFFAFCLLSLWLGARVLYKPIPVHPARKALPCLCISLACLASLTNLTTLKFFGAVDIRYDQYQNYQTNGFIVATLMNLTDSGVESPVYYSDLTVSVLRGHIEAAASPAPLGEPPKPPHIIALQMEAFSDPQLIDPRITYEKDPFSPLEAYAAEIQRFHTLVSVLGGGTSNTEYEFLTGYNTYFCPPGVTPFIRYMNKTRPSLVSDLAKMGYRTVAVHPHTGSFYNRDKVYPRLGFSRFVTIEEFNDPVYTGFYIADETFGQKVIELYEEERGGGPLFLLGVSIQNHGPYSHPSQWRHYPVSVGGGLALTGAQIKELETFGANIYDSSTMLANLIRYFSESDEPVLLLAYGDHQAAWPWTLEMPGGPELELRRYSTESFFWANYPLERDSRPLISASGLGPWMMRKAGLMLPLYAKGVDLQFEDLMAYNIAITVENDGNMRYVERERVEGFRLLQYDRMFGSDYLENENSS